MLSSLLRNRFSCVCEIGKSVLPLIWTPVLCSGIYQVPLAVLILKQADRCIGWKWHLLRNYAWNKNEDLICKNAHFCSSVQPGGTTGWCSCLPHGRVSSCGLVLKLFTLRFAPWPLGSLCIHFHSSPAPVLLNTEPPSSHLPNPTFQPRDLMVPGVSPLPCRQAARWLLQGNRREHKLTVEEQDALCIFLRPGIQFPFRGCIFFNSSLKIEQNISCCSYFLIISFPLHWCIESQKLENGKDVLDHV